MNAGRVVTGWLALVALYTALTQSEKIAGLLGTTTTATRALSDPTRPLIRDRATAAASSGPSGSGMTSSGRSVNGGLPTPLSPSGVVGYQGFGYLFPSINTGGGAVVKNGSYPAKAQ